MSDELRAELYAAVEEIVQATEKLAAPFQENEG
jgi:hypothetical protein